jgi:uncharacterized protein (AIM24 family)
MPDASYTCPYCRTDSEGGPACPHCGAPVDVRARTSGGGWVEQPPIRDLTRLHFSHSSCQISGAYVPVAELALDAADSVYFTHHALLHAEPSVDLDLMRMPSGWQRSLAGLPVYIMTARGPGHLAIRAGEPGETIAVPLLPGRSIDVAEHRFLGATGNVTYQWRPADVWYKTKHQNEAAVMHYPVGGAYFDRFESTQTPGLLLLHAPGSTFIRDLADGETVYVKPQALVWKDQSAQASLHSERMRDGQGFFMWVKLRGPGRVMIKSIFGFAGWRGTIVDSTPRTTHTW